MTPKATRVYLEETSKSAFAVALDWPGWCRHAKTGELAIEALLDYRDRYAEIVDGFAPGRVTVIGTVPGNRTTDYGAPDARGPWDESPLSQAELTRQLAVVTDCWDYFDRVIAAAPPALRKGPRGGGRDRDAVVNHVREAERAYSSRIGARILPRTPWPEARRIVLEGLRAGSTNPKWPTPYAIRRLAWHVTDHAWEVQDKGG